MKRSNNLKKEFVILFLLVSMIPSGIVGVVSYRLATSLMMEQKADEIETKLDKIKTGVNEKLSQKETLGIKFYLDSYVQDLLIKNKDDQETFYQVMKLLFSNEYTDVNDILFLCSTEGKIYTNSMIATENARPILEEGIEKLKDTGRTFAWLEPVELDEVRIIPFIREISDLYGTYDSTPGYMVTGVQEKLLCEIYESYFQDEGERLLVINQEKTILSGNNLDVKTREKLASYKIDQSVSKKVPYYEAESEGNTYFLVKLADEKNKWDYIYLLDKHTALSSMKDIQMVPVLGMIISFAISVFMSFLASVKILKPIKELTNTMQKVEEGNMDIRFKVPNIQEIADLGNFFNQMMEKLQDSIDKIYAVQKQRRDAELKALVLQINPHFLYNTLSSIIWLCNADKKEDVIEMTSSLATLFRISISRGQEIVTIREEFEHAKSYVRIQQIRFDNKFSCYVDMDEEIADCFTLKVILQPLVENSINHAITNIDYPGLIALKAEKEDDVIVLSVTDNAEGMNEEQVEELNRHLEEPYDENEQYGIGTSNVNNRIKLLFGNQYGLKFRKRGKNIIAEIRIPVVYGDTMPGK